MSRDKIPVSLRNVVWLKYVGGEGTGVCQCCYTQEIKRTHFICGHVVSVADGGPTNVANLRPVCADCNGGMGTMNMFEFQEMCGFEQPPVEGKAPTAEKKVPATEKKASAHAIQLSKIEKAVTIKKKALEEAFNVIAATTIFVRQNGRIVTCGMDGKQFATIMSAQESYVENRPPSISRARAFAAAEKEFFTKKGYYRFSDTPLVLCRIKNSGLFLVDGQHRYLAWKTLERPEAADWIIDIVSCDSLADVEAHFVRINSGTPVPAIYYDQKAALVVREFIQAIEMEHPGIVEYEDEKKPQRPRFNRTTYEEALCGATAGALRRAIVDQKVDCTLLMKAAKNVCKRVKDEYKTNAAWMKNSANLKAWTRAEKNFNGFYMGVLGSTSDWPDKVTVEVLTLAGLSDDE